MYVDLHMHTKHSDGKLDVRETINTAYNKNIGMISITDHDSIGGVKEAIEYSKSLHIKCISGIELSCRNDNLMLDFPQDVSVHLLGYNIDYNCSSLVNHLSKYQKKREAIILKVLNELRNNDFDIKYDDIHIISGNQMRIQDIINHINHKNLDEIKKDKLLSIVRGYYFDLFSQDSSLEHAINLIKNSGGLSVLAHAFFSYRDYQVENNSQYHILNLLDYLYSIGLDGIEAFYPRYSQEQSVFLQTEAIKRGMFVTAGSDFHGTEKRKAMMNYDIKQIERTVCMFNEIGRY